MKTKIVLLLLMAVFMFTGNVSHARKPVRYLTYEIVAVTEDSITMRYKDGREYVLHWKPKGLKVGDRVRYDKGRHKLKREPLPKDEK